MDTASWKASPDLRVRRGVADWAGLLLTMVVTVVIYGWIAVGAETVFGFSDSIDYLFMADFYRSTFSGHEDLSAVAYYRTTRFPPLFPLFLAVFGAGSSDQQLACILTSTTVVAAVLLVWLWARIELDSASGASLVAMSLAANPGFFLLVLNPVSEPLAMILVWASFLLVGARHLTLTGIGVAALLVGVSTLARSSGIALVAALIVWLVKFKPLNWAKIAVASVLAGGPFFGWMIYRASLPRSESYLDTFQSEIMLAELGGWPDLLYLQPLRVFEAFAKNWSVDVAAHSLVVAAVVLLLAAVGWVGRIRQNSLDAWFISSYLAMILLWPFPTEVWRFMTFILPVVVLSAIQGAEVLLKRPFLESRSRTLIATSFITLLILVASGSSLLRFLERARIAVDAELRGDQREQVYFRERTTQIALQSVEVNARIRLAASELGRYVPVGECVYAVSPQLVRLHGHVSAAALPTRISPDVPLEAQFRRCNYFFAAAYTFTGLNLPAFYPVEQIADWVTPVLISYMDVGKEKRMVAGLFVRTSQKRDTAWEAEK